MDLAELGLRVDSSQVRRANKDLDRFQREGKESEKTAGKMGSAFGKAAAGLAAVVGSTAAIGKVVTTLRNFDSAMAKVAAISGATGDELEALRNTAKELGATTEFSASQAADALGFLAMAGFDAEEAIAAIPGVLDLATASGMDLARTADIASNILSGFGMEAENVAQVTDALAKQASISNTNVEQLGSAMSYVAPVANTLGISIGDTAAAVGVLSDAGVQGTRAGTALRAMMSKLVKPTDSAASAMRALNIDLQDINPAANSLDDVLDALAEGNIDLAAATELVGIEAASNLITLVESRDKYREYAAAQEQAAGSTAKMAATMRDTLTGSFNGLNSAIEGLIIELGEAGLTNAIRSVIDTATELVRALSGFEQLPEVAAGFGALAAAALAVVFPLGAVASAAAVAAGYLWRNWESLSQRFPGLTGAVETALDMAGAAFGRLRNAVDGIGAFMSEQLGLMVDAADAALRGDWQAAWDDARQYVQNWADVLTTVKDTVTTRMNAIWGAVRDAIDSWGPQILSFAQIAFDNIPEALDTVKDRVSLAIGQVWNAIRDAIDAWGPSLLTLVETAFQNLPDGVEAVLQAVENAVGALWNAIIGNEGEAIGTWGPKLLSAVKKAAESIGAGIIEVAPDAGEAVVEVWKTVKAKFEDWEKAILDVVADAARGIIDGLKSVISDIPGVMGEIWDEIKRATSGWKGEFTSIGQDIVAGLGDGVRLANPFARVGQWLADQVVSGTKKSLGIQSPSKVFAGLGEDTWAGYIEGLKDKTPDVLAEIEETATRATDTAAGAMQDGINGMVDYMLDGFRDGLDGLWDMFVDTLKQMAAAAIRNRIVVPIMGQITGGGVGNVAQGLLGGGGGIAGAGINAGGFLGLGGLGGGILGNFGNVGGILGMGGLGGGVGFLGGLGNALSGGFANIFNIGANASAALGGLGATIGAALPVIGLAAAAISFFSSKTKELDRGLRITAEQTDVLVESFRKVKKSRFWGLSTSKSTNYKPVADDVGAPIQNAVNAIRDQVGAAAEALGFGAKTWANFSASIKVSTKGLSDEEAQKAVEEALQGLGDKLADYATAEWHVLRQETKRGILDLSDGFAGLVRSVGDTVWVYDSSKSALDDLKRSGEGTFDTLMRLAGNLMGVNATLDMLGLGLMSTGLEGAKAAQSMVDVFGSLEAFNQAAGVYYQNFYTQAEQLANLQEQFKAGLVDAGVQHVVPQTREAFRRLVERVHDLGREADAAALMGLAPLFLQIEQMRASVNTLAPEAGQAANATAALTQAQRDKLAATNAELQQVQVSKQGIYDRVNALNAELAQAQASANASAQRKAALLAEKDELLGSLNGLNIRTNALLAEKYGVLDSAAASNARTSAINAENAAVWTSAQVTQQRAQLEMELLRLQGKTAEIRQRELRNIAPQNRDLQRRIWALQDQANAQRAAANASRTYAEASRRQAANTNAAAQATQQQAQATQNAGNAARQSTGASYGRSDALRSETAAVAAANSVAQERARLELELLRLQGNTAEIRRRELQELHPSNRALQKQIWSLQDAQRAASSAAQATRSYSDSVRQSSTASSAANNYVAEKERLERRIWELRGWEKKLREAELDDLSSANRERQKLVWKLEHRKEIQDERKRLEDRLLNLQGNTAELRRRELEALKPANRELQLMIWRLEDASEAIGDLVPDDFATRYAYLRAQADRRMGKMAANQSNPPLYLTQPSQAAVGQAGAAASQPAPSESEIKALREEMRQLLLSINKHSKDQARILKDWDAVGMPAERSA